MTPRGARRLLVGAALWWCCVGAGCDLFKPAVPEPPSGQALVGDYSEPDSTLDSMARAIRAKGSTPGAPDTYRAALANPLLDGRGFDAQFDPITVATYESGGQRAPLPWNYASEVSFYDNFASQNGQLAYDMQWSLYPQGGAQDSTADSVKVYRTYQVFMKLANGKIDTLGYGHATLRLVRSNSKWVLVQWIDLEDAAAPRSALSYGGLRFKYP